MVMTQGQGKYVDNLKLRKFTGNTSVYSTNYSNMSITANALDGWAPDNWSTTSATVDQAAGQYRLVAIGTGATAKVQREFTAMPNQEHRFQYNLSLLNGGSTTVRVEQKVNGVYQYLATQQTQTTSGTYELSFVPQWEDIRISVSGTSRYALNNLYLDRDQIDTLISTYALSRGYRYGFQGQEKDDEVSGKGNSYTAEFWQYDSRLGRRWNIDPVVKYHRSPYDVLSNNPIIMVDPDGNDDYYNSDGSYNKKKSAEYNNNGSHNIYVLSADGNSSRLLSDMPIKTDTEKKVVQRIINVYAIKAGVQGYVKLKYHDPGENKKSPAFTIDGKVYVNSKGGLSKSLSNYHNLENVMFHEKVHECQYVDKNKEDDETFSGLLNHIDVYQQQMNDDSFIYTSKDFKDNQIDVFKKYIELALNKTNTTYDEAESVAKVAKIINSFNGTSGKKHGYFISTNVVTVFDKKYYEVSKHKIKDDKKKGDK